MKERSGRIGEPQEYTEFSVGKHNFVAQKSGASWYVYYVQRQGVARFVSKGYAYTQAGATEFAKQMAQAYEAKGELKL